ncbi:MAG: F-type H+-transporting ATPase subunit epsilon [Proteobacteria bacterium]|nr:F-type H+-transporting ATPase subunit epsilon [Pseudomonadota bacterium]
MTATLRLIITTPATVLVDDATVVALRAEDESGGFGILPGHTDLLTVLTASVIRWRNAAGAMLYCAVRGGVLTVTDGARVAVACREGTVDSDLPKLEAAVEALRTRSTDEGRQARVEQMRLHAQAVRQLMRLLRSASPGNGGHA